MNYVEKLDRPLTNNEVDFNIDSLATRLKQVGAEDMSLILRRDLSRPLTSREMDNNFHQLDVVTKKLLYGDGPYPTLDLRFAGATLLDPRVEFTRASTATYTGAIGNIRTAAINEPRFTYDPMTGESLGLLVEGQATNLVLWSEDFSQTFWSTKPKIIEIGVPSPAGTPSWKLSGGGGVQGEDVLQSDFISISAVSGTFVASFFIKKASNSVGSFTLRILTSNGQTQVKIDLGSLADQPTLVNETGDNQFIGAESEPMNDGWHRVSVVFSVGETSTFRWRSFTEDKSSNYHLWGAQLEEGTHPTSYIPTEGSQATRIADTPTIPVGDWFNPIEGTFVVEGAATPSESNHVPLLKAGVGLTGNFGLMIGRAENGVYTLRTRDGGAIPEINLGTASGIVSIAASYTTGGNVSACMNGGEVYSAENNWAVGATGVWVGSGGIGGVQQADRRANGPISRITYYPRALSNEQLQALTS